MVSLGMARTAEIQRDARIGEAEANKDSQIETAIAEEQRLAAKLINDAEIERCGYIFHLILRERERGGGEETAFLEKNCVHQFRPAFIFFSQLCDAIFR